MAATEWKHDALAEDLAAHLRGSRGDMVTWLDMQLGPAGSPRPDVYAIAHTYTALAATAYEVKVSRSDFLRDACAGKALGYLKFAGAVVFAAPAGMLKKTEIPGGCGLIERHAEVWRFARKPVRQRLENLPWTAWVKLVTDGRGRELGTVAGREARGRQAVTWRADQLARKVLGAELGKLYADRDTARMMLRHDTEKLEAERKLVAETREAERIQARSRVSEDLALVAEPLRQAREALALPDDASARDIVAAIRDSWPDTAKAQVKAAADAVGHATRNLEWAQERLAEHARTLGLLA